MEDRNGITFNVGDKVRVLNPFSWEGITTMRVGSIGVIKEIDKKDQLFYSFILVQFWSNSDEERPPFAFYPEDIEVVNDALISVSIVDYIDIDTEDEK